MKVSVCSTVYYHYEVELPDWMCEKDEKGDLAHEALLVESCYEADPVTLDGIDGCDAAIVSIYDENDNALYIQ